MRGSAYPLPHHPLYQTRYVGIIGYCVQRGKFFASFGAWLFENGLDDIKRLAEEIAWNLFQKFWIARCTVKSPELFAKDKALCFGSFVKGYPHGKGFELARDRTNDDISCFDVVESPAYYKRGAVSGLFMPKGRRKIKGDYISLIKVHRSSLPLGSSSPSQTYPSGGSPL